MAMILLATLWAATSLLQAPTLAQDVKPLTRTHAHNDYAHPHPLADALAEGFCSVEADIFLVGGELLVGHNRKDLKKDRTLDRLYLKPLAQLVKQNQGSVYKTAAPFTLLIDIKEDGDKVYEVLAKQLDRYRGIFSGYDRKGKRIKSTGYPFPFHQRAISAVLSGDRPIDRVKADPQRIAFIDGRLVDLDLPFSADLTPLISEGYDDHFKWNGRGVMPSEEREKLLNMVRRVHGVGAKFRLWAIPDTQESWQEMYEAGVDLINTDRLAALGKFLRAKS